MKRLVVLLGCVALMSSAWAGTAYYGGLTGDVGTLIWDPAGTVADQYLVLQPNNDGTHVVGAFQGSPVGALTTDGTNLLAIPTGADFTIEAGWMVPAPQAYKDPANGTPRDSYMFIGLDNDGAIQDEGLRFGMMYKEIGEQLQWVVRAQDLQTAATEVGLNNYRPTYIKVRVSYLSGGGIDYAGTSVVKAEYSLDWGPWQSYMFDNTEVGGTGFSTEWPIEASGGDISPLTVTFAVQGLGTAALDPVVTGANVPNVNVGAGALDTDGDGVVDHLDPWPNNAAYALDSDNDGLPDEWEMAYFGHLAFSALDDANGNGKTNLQAFLTGADPSATPIPAASAWALLALCLGIAVVGGAVAFRKVRS
jgi:hypothetical protein